MSKLRLIAAAALLAGLAATGQAVLAQQAINCDWYADTALKQQKLNADRKCGLKGESWHFDRTAHVAWCQGVGPDQWRLQAQFRDQELAKCQAKR